MVLNDILNPVLGPLFRLPLAAAVIIISFFIALIITIIYKYTTDQTMMKQLKDEMKDLQKKAKELRTQPEKAMKVQQKIMQANMKYMKQSFKSTLFTFLPIILIFGWLQANIAYEPIQPGQEFNVIANMRSGEVGTVKITVPEGVTIISDAEKEISDNTVYWTLSADSGTYLLDLKHNSDLAQKELKVDAEKYGKVEERYKNSFKSITISYEKSKPFGALSILGWQPGWLGTYIIFSMIFSLLLRKVMKLY